jgi:maltose alpha-D-glucosyltransferase/alpha-amylase
MAAPPPDLAAAAAATFNPRWLAARRWFRAKRRRLASVSLADAAPLGAAPREAEPLEQPPLDPTSAWLLALDATYADGGPPDSYLVPAIAERGRLREPHDGDGAWRALVRLTALRAEVAGLRGRFRLQATPVLDELLPSATQAALALDERRLRVEQTNTSVVLGERLILKIYRLLEVGENPDVEVPRFLTEVRFPHTPAVAGWGEYTPPTGEPCAALMLQRFLAAAGDAWGWLLGELRSDAGETAGLDGVSEIGRQTAQLHEALASRPDDPAFPVRRADPDTLSSWRTSALRQLEGALAAVEGAERRRLERVASAIRDRFAAMERIGPVPVSRIHGDYHLGQLLVAGGRFWVIDFEGEPARPAEERRLPSSPLRDVAGMLRSLDYAARTASRAESLGAAPDPLADGWLGSARDALLAGYAAGRPALSADERALLVAFELEKACYEVRYEAAMRPNWVWLPLEGIEHLANA